MVQRSTAQTISYIAAPLVVIVWGCLGFYTAGWLLIADAVDEGLLLYSSLAAAAALLLTVSVAIARRAAWMEGVFGVVGGLVIVLCLGLDSRPLPRAPFPPLPPQAQDSYAVLMWMAKDGPLSRVRESKRSGADSRFKLPTNRGEWPSYVQNNAAEIEQAWADSVLEREFIDRLNAFPSVADLIETFDGKILAFSPIRRLAYDRLMYAVLLAERGRHEESIAVLVPLVEVSQKIQTNARTLVTAMVMVVVLRQCLEVSDYIADRPELPQATLEPLRQAFLRAPAMSEVIRNVFEFELRVNFPWPSRYEEFPSPGGGTELEETWLACLALPYVHPLAINRNETLRVKSEWTSAFVQLAADRKEADLAAFVRARLTAPLPWKNFVGQKIMRDNLATQPKLVTNWWTFDDQRLALLKKLEKP